MWGVIALLLAVSFYSCNEEADLTFDQGYDFFPLSGGQFRTYQVEEVIITGSVPDTSHYFLKEVLADSIVHESQMSYLVYRYVTEDTTTAWRLDSVWAARRSGTQAVVVENNIPFVKLIFPVKSGASWDGNALNARGEFPYFYESVESLQIGEEAFSAAEVIRVVIADVPENLVEQDERSEVYVRGIGLAQKNYLSASFCQPGSGCEEVGIIDKGRILNQVLVAYGEE